MVKHLLPGAWKLLTEEYGLDKDRIYVTVFGGDKDLKLEEDAEAKGGLTTYAPILLTLMIATLILAFRSVTLAALLGAVAVLSDEVVFGRAGRGAG